MMDLMSTMQDRIISSLGAGYDDESLRALDRKLCDFLLPPDSFYYDDDANVKSSDPEVPTDDEIERYAKSDIIRRKLLRSAGGPEATMNYLGGMGHKNLDKYQKFYDDVMTYHFAWFEIIFKKNRTDLLMACMTIVKFASVKLGADVDDVDVDEVVKIMNLLRELKGMFQDSVKSDDVEACDDAGMLEFDFYECQYKLSIAMAEAGERTRQRCTSRKL